MRFKRKKTNISSVGFKDRVLFKVNKGNPHGKSKRTLNKIDILERKKKGKRSGGGRDFFGPKSHVGVLTLSS